MATYKSRAFVGRVRYRNVSEEPFEVVSTVLVPAGKTLLAGDLLKFCKLGQNVNVLAATLSSSALEDSGNLLTVSLGWRTEDDVTLTPNGFINASITLGRGGVAGVNRVENGGSTAFATSPYVPNTKVIVVEATIVAAPSVQTVAAATDRFLTCTLVAVKNAGYIADVPYIYRERYNPATGVGTI